MKFRLEPNNRDASDEEMLEDVRRVSRLRRKPTVTMSEYNQYGRFHSSTLHRRFGSWFTVLERAGLKESRTKPGVPADSLLQDLDSVAKRLGVNTLAASDYDREGKYSSNTIIRRFGSWFAALEQVGLKRTRPYGSSDAEYFHNLQSMWLALGRQPRYGEVKKPLSSLSCGAYERRFGSWRKALQAFITYVNTDNPTEGSPLAAEAPATVPPAMNDQRTNRYREPTERIRLPVFIRDSCRCKICGRSSTDPEVSLHLDHIIPKSKGGLSTMENLQTLCNRCNLGKSDLLI